MAGDGAGPLTAAAFARAMAAFAPFEARPVLAVAVSGGADSMALALLAAAWAAARGGRVLGLTVDHRLRAESAAEAALVGRWLAACGIAHRILVWPGPQPATGLQARARAARYRLLEDASAAEGILHLLVAHHRDDQAETRLLRLARGSGDDGAAGMPAVRETAALRILRPLLAVPAERLRATCRAAGQDWVDDPGNRSDRFARSRLRRQGGFDAAAEALAAKAAGRHRASAERATAALAGRIAALHPEGYAVLDRAGWCAAPAGLADRLLAACLRAVGPGAPGPGREELRRLAERLRAGLGGTLGGCLVQVRPRRLLVLREAGRAPSVAAAPGAGILWDGRFRVTLPAGLAEQLVLGPLGLPPRREPRPGLPAAAVAAAPALRQAGQLIAAPSWCGAGAAPLAARFRPAAPLAGAGFAVV